MDKKGKVMKRVIVIFVVIFLTTILVVAASGGVAEKGKSEIDLDKERPSKDFLSLALLPTILIICFQVGIAGWVNYKMKTPWKFAVVEEIEFVVSWILTLTLAGLFLALLNIEGTPILLLIWMLLVFWAIYEAFCLYINIPLFGYKRPGQLWRDRKRKELEEK